MKFFGGLFGGATSLHGTHEGRSRGLYEISAKKSRVPAKSRMMAKTSFHALFFAERATVPIVNPRAHVSISFVLDSNLVRINQKMQIVRIDPIAHPIRGRRPSYPKAGARS